jgi:uracil-DNA glycosylase
MTWDDLKFWDSGEWQVIEEKLHDLKKAGVVVNPTRANLFSALKQTKFETCRVGIIGQDPYPDPRYATGLAFSIPETESVYPPTLCNIFTEYGIDLSYPTPPNGSLVKWAKQGVLLWNAIPTCEAFKAASHRDWTEWNFLTKEIVEELSKKGAVIALLGNIAKEFEQYVDKDHSKVLLTSHPSPRGILTSKHPFMGSRFFSTINGYLCDLGKEPINWRLT